MSATQRLRASALALAVAALAAPTAGAEVIQIRTGQVGGAPGTIPTSDSNGPVDDCFRYTTEPLCGQPLRSAPFTAGDFNLARSGNFAELVAPAGAWLPSLPADPDARWINWNHGTLAGGSGDPPASVLYACDFVPETPCPTATVEVWWAVDDALGDPGGPNPIGIYINGTPLSAGFSGGSLGAQSYAIQTGVPLLSGTNTLYAYQADDACVVSGLILSARITCEGQPGEIRGTKYHDLDCDGVRDAGEPGLGGWTIMLDPPNGPTTVTNANGDYAFVVAPGTYTVTEQTQMPYILTAPATGSHTVNVGCNDDVAGLDFGNCLCKEVSDLPPECTVGWYPFQEASGPTTVDPKGGNTGNVFGSPWGAGYISPGLDLPNVGDFVEAGAVTPSFGLNDFSITAWMRSSNGDPARRTIAEKHHAGNATGWSFYLIGNRLAFDMWAGGSSATWVSPGAVVTDGFWHHVAVAVCRDISPSQPGSVTFYVDGLVDAAFPGGGQPVGSVDAPLENLAIGQRSPTNPRLTAFAGELDEVMFFAGCCDQQTIIDAANPVGFVTASAHVPSTQKVCGASSIIPLTICNYGALPQSYRWTIAGMPASGSCNVPGPTAFSPTAGTVSLAPGQCQTVNVTIATPPGLGAFDRSCYQVRVVEQGTGRCFKADGSLRGESWVWASPVEDWGEFTVGEVVEVVIEVENPTADFQVLDCELVPWSLVGDGPSPSVGLDGLPPGEPIVRTVKLPPESFGPITLELEFQNHEALNITELRLIGDPDGTGDVDTITALGMRSLLDAVVGTDKPEPTVEVVGRLRAAPNPFAAETTITFGLGRSQSATLRVFDVAGRLVRTLVNGGLAAGTHVARWDGRGADGRASAPGVYWLKLESPELDITRKVLRLDDR